MFGQPVFGKAAFGPAASKSLPEAGDIDPTSATKAKAVELTDEEKRMRDAITQAHRRSQQEPVSIYVGEGPQATRSGRPDPTERSRRLAAEAASLRGQAFYKAHYGSKSSAQPQHRDLPHRSIQQSEAKPDSSRTQGSSVEARNQFAGNRGEVGGQWSQSRRPTNGEDQRNDGAAVGNNPRASDSGRNDDGQWGQLRRRGNSASQASQPEFIDRFAQERHEREQRAQTRQFTPLSRSVEPVQQYSPVTNDVARQGVANNGRLVQRVEQRLDRPETRGSRHVRSSQAVPSGFGGIRRVEIAPSESASIPTRAEARRTVEGQFRKDLPLQEAQDYTKSSSNQDNSEHKPLQDKPRVQESTEPVTLRPISMDKKPQDDALSFKERQARYEQSARARFETLVAQEPPASDTPKGKLRDKEKRRAQFVNKMEESEHDAEAARIKAEERKARKEAKAEAKRNALTPIILPAYITVANLATALRVKFEDFKEKLTELGYEDVEPDHVLGGEDAGLIAGEYKFEPLIDRGEVADLKPRPPPEDLSVVPPRPPVVTIMGHVDHGKTTLLDYLRKSSVAATEHGGITQHIGAFSVRMPGGKIITFLDTPGHAAFLSMRQRGANVTDIVILVVAADDSVKPQTIEAINHAKSAKVPIIVAINKIDKPEADVERVKQDLARHGIEVEDYGGDVQVVPVSGKTGQGIDDLEDTLVALTEIIDMRAEVDGPAEGWVLEASLKSMGKVATVLVRRGTMRPGDFIVAGSTWARIRCLRNEAGAEIEEAGPGTPVEIDGWREQPLAGDEVLQAESEAQAKDVVDYRVEKYERDLLAKDMEAINESRKEVNQRRAEQKRISSLTEEEQLAEAAEVKDIDQETGARNVYFILKGDVSGSVEAVLDSVAAIGNKEVVPKILRSGVGQLAEFDVSHAAAAKGFLINFNTPVDPAIAGMAERSGVPILDHNVIYRLVDDVKARVSQFLKPIISYKVLGEGEVAQVFSITVKGRQQKAVAGVKVRNGTIARNAPVRVLRDGEKVFDGKFSHPTSASLANFI